MNISCGEKIINMLITSGSKAESKGMYYFFVIAKFKRPVYNFAVMMLLISDFKMILN